METLLSKAGPIRNAQATHTARCMRRGSLKEGAPACMKPYRAYVVADARGFATRFVRAARVKPRGERKEGGFRPCGLSGAPRAAAETRTDTFGRSKSGAVRSAGRGLPCASPPQTEAPWSLPGAKIEDGCARPRSGNRATAGHVPVVPEQRARGCAAEPHEGAPPGTPSTTLRNIAGQWGTVATHFFPSSAHSGSRCRGHGAA